MFELPNVPNDTSSAIEVKVIELLAEMPPEKKLARIFDLSAFAKSLIVADIGQSRNFKTEKEKKMELARRIYGPEIGEQIAKMYSELI